MPWKDGKYIPPGGWDTPKKKEEPANNAPVSSNKTEPPKPSITFDPVKEIAKLGFQQNPASALTLGKGPITAEAAADTKLPGNSFERTFDAMKKIQDAATGKSAPVNTGMATFGKVEPEKPKEVKLRDPRIPLNYEQPKTTVGLGPSADPKNRELPKATPTAPGEQSPLAAGMKRMTDNVSDAFTAFDSGLRKGTGEDLLHRFVHGIDLNKMSEEYKTYYEDVNSRNETTGQQESVLSPKEYFDNKDGTGKLLIGTQEAHILQQSGYKPSSLPDWVDKAADTAGQGLGMAFGGGAMKGVGGAAIPTLTKVGTIKAAGQAVATNALDRVGAGLAKGALFGAGTNMLEGGTAPDIENRNLAQKFGASIQSGAGDTIELAGSTANWLGYKRLGEQLKNVGQAQKAGYEVEAPEGPLWQKLLNPEYYATTVARTLPTSFVLMPFGMAGMSVGAGIGAAAGLGAFGRTIMGAIGASALATPLEAAMEAGAVYEETGDSAAADKTFWGNLGVLGITNALEFGSIFAPKGISKVLDSTAGRTGIGAATGAVEETLQDVVSKNAMGMEYTFDPEQAAIGGIIGGGLSFAGGVGQNNDINYESTYATPEDLLEQAKNHIRSIQSRVINKLDDAAKADLNTAMEEAKAKGMTDDQAIQVMMDIVASTHPNGEQLIQEAVQEVAESEQLKAETKSAKGIISRLFHGEDQMNPIDPSELMGDPNGSIPSRREMENVERLLGNENILNSPRVGETFGDTAIKPYTEMETQELIDFNQEVKKNGIKKTSNKYFNGDERAARQFYYESIMEQGRRGATEAATPVEDGPMMNAQSEAAAAQSSQQSGKEYLSQEEITALLGVLDNTSKENTSPTDEVPVVSNTNNLTTAEQVAAGFAGLGSGIEVGSGEKTAREAAAQGYVEFTKKESIDLFKSKNPDWTHTIEDGKHRFYPPGEAAQTDVQQTPATSPRDQKEAIDNIAVGQTFTIKGKGDQKFTVTGVKGKMVTAKDAKHGGDMTIPKQAISSVLQEDMTEVENDTDSIAPIDVQDITDRVFDGDVGKATAAIEEFAKDNGGEIVADPAATPKRDVTPTPVTQKILSPGAIVAVDGVEGNFQVEKISGDTVTVRDGNHKKHKFPRSKLTVTINAITTDLLANIEQETPRKTNPVDNKKMIVGLLSKNPVSAIELKVEADISGISLADLEQEGLIESFREQRASDAKQFHSKYRITEKGKAYLDDPQAARKYKAGDTLYTGRDGAEAKIEGIKDGSSYTVRVGKNVYYSPFSISEAVEGSGLFESKQDAIDYSKWKVELSEKADSSLVTDGSTQGKRVTWTNFKGVQMFGTSKGTSGVPDSTNVLLDDGRTAHVLRGALSVVNEPQSGETESKNFTGLKNAATGKPFKATLFQGRGASPVEVYGQEAVDEGRAVPILGPGQYYADTQQSAKNYGNDIRKHEVTLNNPFVIANSREWRDLLEKSNAKHLDSRAGLFYQDPQGIPEATERLQSYLVAQGHDGIVVRVGDDRSLSESFAHDQAVVFGKAKEQPSTNSAGPLALTSLLSKYESSYTNSSLIEDVTAEIGNHEQAIMDLIKRHGNGEMEVLDDGSGSIIFDIGNNKIARIGLGQFANVPVSKHVNQPHVQKMFGMVRVEIYDKLDTKGIKSKDIDLMEEMLEKEGLVFFDPGQDNLGRNKKGELLVLDPGAVKPKGYKFRGNPSYDAGTKLEWTKDGKKHSGIATGKDMHTDNDDDIYAIKVGDSIVWVSSNDGITEEGSSSRENVTVKTEAGTEIEVKYKVVNAADLITSNHAMSLTVNKNYPSELQPRDRSRAASEEQIQKIAGNIEPTFLGESPKASEGAPIVDSNGIVESGNGRVMAIVRAYTSRKDKNHKYRTWLYDNAEKFGIDPMSMVGNQNPILVRERVTPMSQEERLAFVQEANQQSVAAMSAIEQAKMDAAKLKGGLLSIFNPGEDANIAARTNREFVRGFMQTVVPSSERGRYVDAEGALNQDGVRRITNAIFARVYGASNALERMAESTDNNVRNITNAMLLAAPRLLRMKEAIEAGDAHPLDITNDIAEAANKLSEIRDNGQTVEFYLNQGDMFGSELTDEGKNILSLFDANKRSTKKITEVLSAYADVVLEAGSPNQISLFDDGAVPTKLESLEAAIRRAENEGGEQIALWNDTAEGSQETDEVSRTEVQEETEPQTNFELKPGDRAVNRIFWKKGTYEIRNRDHVLVDGGKVVDDSLSPFLLVKISGKFSPSKPIADMDAFDLTGEVVNHIVKTTPGLSETLQNGKKNEGIQAFKNAVVGLGLEGDEITITGHFDNGPDKRTVLTINSPVTSLPIEISNFRDLIETHVHKTIEKPTKKDTRPSAVKAPAVAPKTNVLNDHHARMKERAEAAKKRIKSKYGSGGNTLNSLFPPDLMIDLSIIGYTKILDGAADFKAWSDEMMKEAKGIVSNSERIHKWLPSVYTMSKQIAESDDPDALMDEFLTDAYGDNPDAQMNEPVQETSQEKVEPVRTLKPLPDDAENVNPEEFNAYVAAARSVIDRFRDAYRNDELPTTQAGFRKMASEVLGRPATEDEWSDLLEAALQEHANEGNPNGILEDKFKQAQTMLKTGTELEKNMKNAARSMEKAQRQQFSTPIPLATIASYALSARQGELIKEGSAGTGSLALPVQNIWGATVKAVELSPRRAAILQALGIDVLNQDAFKENVKADSVIGNPPFKGQNVGKGTVAFSGKPPWRGGWGDLANRFLAWDLRSIEDGGRLVYITSPGVIDGAQNGEFRKWLNENHTVLAMVKIHDGGYDTRGTKFGAGIIVVEKGKTGTPVTAENHKTGTFAMRKRTNGKDQEVILQGIDLAPTVMSGPNAGKKAEAITHWIDPNDETPVLSVGRLDSFYYQRPEAITGTAESFENLLDMLKPLGEDGAYGRVAQAGRGERASRDGARSESTDVRGGTRSGQGTRSETTDGRGRPNDTSSDTTVGPGVRPDRGRNESGTTEGTPGRNESVQPSRAADVVEPGDNNIPGDVSQNTETTSRNDDRPVQRTKEVKPAKDINDDVSGFVEYVPSGGLSGRAHMGEVVEASNLSIIDYPQEAFDNPNNQPHDILMQGKDKKLSDVQLETIVMASHNRAIGKRAVWIADDTGLGKTAEQLAIAADAWHKGEAKRILIITTKDQVAEENFMTENQEFGMKLPLTFVGSETHQNFKDETFNDKPNEWKPLPVKDGAIVMSKYTFAASQEAVKQWLNGADDLMVLIDEAHEFSNVDSQRGMALKDLYDAFSDKSQFVYASATAAENLDDLEYMYGLKLWDTDTFGDFKTRLKGFEPSKSSGGRGAKKQTGLAKALGNKKNPFEREVPLTMMEQIVRELKAEGQYIGRSLSMEGIDMDAIAIHLSPEDIGEYNRAVEFIQRIASKAEEHGLKPTDRGKIITGVVGYMRRLRGYYAMKSIIAHMKQHQANGTLERFVLSGEFKSGDEGKPAMLESAINSINDQDKAKDGTGTTIYTDIPEALEDKATLISMLHGEHADYDFQSPVPNLPSPITMLYDAFGDNDVLVITGDVKVDERKSAVRSFQSGKKNIIFFNSAANTGINLHDTIGKQIGFYHVDYAYSAKSAKQAEGRVNRTGQKTKPIMHYPFIPGSVDTKFVGTLLSRYESMGAMSRGKSSKIGDGKLDDFDFTGSVGKVAVEQVIPMLDPEIRAQMFGEWTRDIPLMPDGSMDPSSLRSMFKGEVEVKKFINYIMLLDMKDGNATFQLFSDVFAETKAQIEREGGATDKFVSYNGQELSKSVGDNVTVRRIKTVMKPAEKKALERRKDKAEDDVQKAEDLMIEARAQAADKARENLEAAEEKLREASTAFSEIEAEIKQARADRVEEKVYERISKRWNKAREDRAKRLEKVRELSDLVETLDRGGQRAADALQQIPSVRRTTSALESARYQLANIEAMMETNESATLIEGKIATGGLMVPIRGALRKAAQAHYGTENPPAAALTLDLRGYQLQDGTRAVGVVIPTWAEGDVLAALNVRMAFNKEGGMSALMAHVKSGHAVELEGGFTLRHNSRLDVIVIAGMRRGSHAELFAQLQDDGHRNDFGFHAQSGSFVVNSEKGLARLVGRFPIKSDDSTYDMASASGASSRTRVSRKSIKSIADLVEESDKILTPGATEQLADILTEHLDTIMVKDFVRPGALGTYNPKANIGNVRSKNFGEWRVIGHEIGHAFSKLKKRIGDAAELRALYQGLYTRPSKSAPVDLQMEEGFAEFFRLWVADPELARQNAPKTTQMFEDYILTDKKLSGVFAKIRTIVDNDLADDALGRAVAGSVIQDITDDGSATGPMYAVKGLKKVFFEMANSLIPARAMAKVAKEENYADPQYLVQLLSIMGDAQTKGLAAFEGKIRDQDGTILIDESLKDKYQALVDEIGKATDWEVTKLATVDKDVKIANKTIYKQFKKMGTMEIAGALLIAKRVVERRTQGFDKLPMTKEMAEEVLEIAEQRFPDAIPLAEDYARSLSRVQLDKLIRAGMLTEEDRKRIEAKSDFYIPFFYNDKKATTTSGRSKGGRTVARTVKRFVGKMLPVLDPLQASILKLTQIEQAIEYKRVLDELEQVARLPNMGAFAQIVPIEKLPYRVDMGVAMENIMKFMGIQESEMGNLSEVLQGNMMTIFNPNPKGMIDKAEPIIMNYSIDPKTKRMKPVAIKLAPDVFKMLMSMRPLQMNGFAKNLARMSRIMRYTALANPVYIQNAVFRDIPMGLAQSANGPGALAKNTAISAGVMIGTYMKHRGIETDITEYMEKQYQLFMSSGAASAASENMLRGMVGKLYDKSLIQTKAPGWVEAVGKDGKRVLTKVINTPSDALRFIEEGPRIAEFVSTLKKEFKKRGHNPDEMYRLFVEEGTEALPADLQASMERIMVQATYDSGEITTNFRMRGANEFLRIYIPTVAFLHGTVQGTARTVRNVREHPVRSLIAVTTIAGISALAYALMTADDDDRKWLHNLQSEQRDKYWWFPNPVVNGTYIAIAKPFDYAIPANMAERFFDHLWKTDPMARQWNEDMASVFSTLTRTELVNNAIKTSVQMAYNSNDFGGPIVPQKEEGKYGWMLASDSSSLARKAAEMYARVAGDENTFNPRMIDYFVRQNFGKWGSTGLSLTNWIKTMAQTGDLSEAQKEWKGKAGAEYNTFGAGSLLRGQAEGGSPRIVQKFYDDYNGTGELMTAVRKLIEAGRIEEVKRLATEENVMKVTLYPAMKEIAAFMSENNGQFDTVINDRNTDPATRHRMTLWKNYFRQMASGVLYQVSPPKLPEIADLPEPAIEAIMTDLLSRADKKMEGDRKTKGGPSEVAEVLSALLELKKK